MDPVANHGKEGETPPGSVSSGTKTIHRRWTPRFSTEGEPRSSIKKTRVKNVIAYKVRRGFNWA